MESINPWLVVWAASVVLNVVPAFMPPTWALLVYFHMGQGLDVLPLALVGAFGATTGRALLALLSRWFGGRVIPKRWRENITALVTGLEAKPALGLSTLLLYTLGPLPSNQLFIAVGIARGSLAPVLAIFAGTRFVSYLIWVSAAITAANSLRESLAPRFGGELAVAVQLVGFILLILVMQVDWASILKRWNVLVPEPAAREREGAGR